MMNRCQAGGAPAKRHSRRLEDKLLIAFHHACDVNDLEIAEQVLRVLEVMLARRPRAPRRQSAAQHGELRRRA